MRIRHHVRKSFIALVGGIVLIGGLLLIPLPGPGLLLTIIGLAILATEFAWAEHWLDKAKNYIEQKTQRLKRKVSSKDVDKHHE